MVSVVSTAQQLQVALEDGDLCVAAEILVEVLGKERTAPGRALQAVMKAVCILPALQVATTVSEHAHVIGEAMELLPFDYQMSVTLGDVIKLTGMSARAGMYDVGMMDERGRPS